MNQTPKDNSITENHILAVDVIRSVDNDSDSQMGDLDSTETITMIMPQLARQLPSTNIVTNKSTSMPSDMLNKSLTYDRTSKKYVLDRSQSESHSTDLNNVTIVSNSVPILNPISLPGLRRRLSFDRRMRSPSSPRRSKRHSDDCSNSLPSENSITCHLSRNSTRRVLPTVRYFFGDNPSSTMMKSSSSLGSSGSNSPSLSPQSPDLSNCENVINVVLKYPRHSIQRRQSSLLFHSLTSIHPNPEQCVIPTGQFSTPIVNSMPATLDQPHVSSEESPSGTSSHTPSTDHLLSVTQELLSDEGDGDESNIITMSVLSSLRRRDGASRRDDTTNPSITESSGSISHLLSFTDVDVANLSTETADTTPLSSVSAEDVSREIQEQLDAVLAAEVRRNTVWEGEELQGEEMSSDENFLDDSFLQIVHVTPSADAEEIEKQPETLIVEEEDEQKEEVEPLVEEDLKESSSEISEADELPSYNINPLEAPVDEILQVTEPLSFQRIQQRLEELATPVEVSDKSDRMTKYIDPVMTMQEEEEEERRLETIAERQAQEEEIRWRNEEENRLSTIAADKCAKEMRLFDNNRKDAEQVIQQLHAARRQAVEERRNAAQEEENRRCRRKHMFEYLFGDCRALLMPYLLAVDMVVGEILQPDDDLLHVSDVIIHKLKILAVDDSTVIDSVLWHRARSVCTGNHEDVIFYMIDEMKSSRYLSCLFTDFSFYYQCYINYLTERVKKIFPPNC